MVFWRCCQHTACEMCRIWLRLRGEVDGDQGSAGPRMIRGLERDLRRIICDVIIRHVSDEEGPVWREDGGQARDCLKACNDSVRSSV